MSEPTNIQSNKYSEKYCGGSLFLLQYSDNEILQFIPVQKTQCKNNKYIDFTILCQIKGGEDSDKSIRFQLEYQKSKDQYLCLQLRDFPLRINRSEDPLANGRSTSEYFQCKQYREEMPYIQELRYNCRNVPIPSEGAYFLCAYLVDENQKDMETLEPIDVCPFEVVE